MWWGNQLKRKAIPGARLARMRGIVGDVLLIREIYEEDKRVASKGMV